jgi:transcriptional regulator with XRE-family HTH domain
MADKNQVYTKKVADLLVSIRKIAKLSQSEVAKQIGLSTKSGRKYISYLETGRIKNPSFSTIILYLDACHTPYLNFFAKFSEIRFKQEHQKLMIQEKLPKDAKTRIKIDRDTALYSNKIKYQTKTPYLDIDKLKAKINRMLDQYMSDHRIDKDLIPTYQDFTSYVLKRVLNPKPNPPLDLKPWLKSGIRPNLLDYINRMIYKIVHQEQKKLSRRKIPTTEKQKKMVIGFLKYRVMIEQVETETHKLLNELEVPFSQYHLYKDFARECFSNLKKLYFKDQSLLSQRFAQSIRGWKEAKLDENVLQKVKETTIKVFQTLFASPIQK